MPRRQRLRNIHPGEILKEEFLQPLRISQYRLAKEIGVPIPRIAEICRGRRAVTANTALRLARFFGTSPKFWLGLQEDFDLESEAEASAAQLDAIRGWAERSGGDRRA